MSFFYRLSFCIPSFIFDLSAPYIIYFALYSFFRVPLFSSRSPCLSNCPSSFHFKVISLGGIPCLSSFVSWRFIGFVFINPFFLFLPFYSSSSLSSSSSCRVAEYVEGGISRWREMSNGRSSDQLVDVLVSELTGSQLPSSNEFIDCKVSSARPRHIHGY